jgi:hypothetical protein
VQRDAIRQRMVQPMVQRTMPTAPRKPLPPETAAALLKATEDEALQDEIIGRLDGENSVLALLELVGDQALKNKLIRRTLAQF